MSNKSVLHIEGRGMLYKSIAIYLVSTLAEFLTQESFYSALFDFQPIQFLGFEVSKSAIVALGIIGLSAFVSHLIKEKVKFKVFFHANGPALSRNAKIALLLVGLFALMCGALNAVLVLKRWELSGTQFETWVQILMIALLTLGSFLFLLVSAVAGSVIMIQAPVLRLQRLERKLESKIIRVQTNIKANEVRHSENERVMGDLETMNGRLVDIEVIDNCDADLGAFMSFLKQQENENKK